MLLFSYNKISMFLQKNVIKVKKKKQQRLFNILYSRVVSGNLKIKTKKRKD